MMRDCASLGAADRSIWPPGSSNPPIIRSTLCSPQQDRCCRCRGDLRGDRPAEDTFRTGEVDGQGRNSSPNQQPCPSLPCETCYGPSHGHWHTPVATRPGKARQQCAEDRPDPEERTACLAASGHTQCINGKGRLTLVPVNPLCARSIGSAAGGEAGWQQQNLALFCRCGLKHARCQPSDAANCADPRRRARE